MMIQIEDRQRLRLTWLNSDFSAVQLRNASWITTLPSAKSQSARRCYAGQMDLTVRRSNQAGKLFNLAVKHGLSSTYDLRCQEHDTFAIACAFQRSIVGPRAKLNAHKEVDSRLGERRGNPLTAVRNSKLVARFRKRLYTNLASQRFFQAPSSSAIVDRGRIFDRR